MIFSNEEKNQQEPLEDFFSSEKIRHITKSRVLSFNANGSNYGRMKCLQKKKKAISTLSRDRSPENVLLLNEKKRQLRNSLFSKKIIKTLLEFTIFGS